MEFVSHFFKIYPTESINNIGQSKDSEFEHLPSGTPFRSFLSQWAIQHNVSQTTLDDLLIELRQNGHSDLPKASKTLLNTSRHAHPTSIDNGTYCHIGIGRCLSAYFLALSKKRYAIPESVTLDFNIDEVSGSKSSQIIYGSFK